MILKLHNGYEIIKKWDKAAVMWIEWENVGVFPLEAAVTTIVQPPWNLEDCCVTQVMTKSPKDIKYNKLHLWLG